MRIKTRNVKHVKISWRVATKWYTFDHIPFSLRFETLTSPDLLLIK
jgi:hypothetical protein